METDHKTLVRPLGEKNLVNLRLRCQKFKLLLMRYQFLIFHTAVFQIFLADMMSRPAAEITQRLKERGKDVELHFRVVTKAEEMLNDMIVKKLKRCAKEDDRYQKVIRETRGGWKEKGKKYRGEIHQFWT